MGEKEEEKQEKVTPGEIIGKSADYKPGKGTYIAANAAGVKIIYASLTGYITISPPTADSPDKGELRGIEN
ncbi:Kinesin-like protein KIF19 [Bienertia sinuspersici]